MYNEKRKLEFLDAKNDKAKFARNLETMFAKSERREEKYGRDIAEWTSGEIISFYKYLATYSIQYLIQLNTCMVEYANWCISNGLVHDNQNHYLEIKTETLMECVDKNELGHLVFSRSQMLEELKDMVNFCDQFVIIATFEGVPINDIVSVKLSDLDATNQILKLSNGETRKVSKELMKIMELANDEKTYISTGGKRTREVEYNPAETTVIRHTLNKKGDVVCSVPMTITATTRMRRATKETDFLSGATTKTIMESGRLYYICENMMKEYHVGFDECVTVPELRLIHEKIFGKIQNQTTYLATYGELAKKLYS